MYSKPKGMYIKNRDREQRRLSPRSEDETDGPADDSLEGRISPRVEVENYGEGDISPSHEPQWPNVFNDDETQVKTPRSSETSNSKENDFPERAKKYMVSSGSLKDLTGEKFITVPTPKTAVVEDTGDQSKSQRLRSNSVRSYGQTSQFVEREVTLPSKPVARVTGTYRGMPSSSGTLRLHSTDSQHKLHNIKAIPRDSHVKSVKNYHVGPYATLRPHNTGHQARHMKAFGPKVDRTKGSVGFKRGTYLHDRKEYCFTQFAIELDRPGTDHFVPGDVLAGRILLEATAKVEIRFVELLIIGLASVHTHKHDPKTAKHAQEVVINKRSYVMGTPNGRWNSLITPGKYVSRFRFVLPLGCPSSMRYENKEQGFSFEIGYLVKARICDEFGSSSARSNHSLHNYVKVLLSRRHPFLVRQTFDIHSIPRALQPVTHSEFVNLGCIPIFVEPTAINLSLDRSVFQVGDEIRVKLVTPGKSSPRIRSMTCNLQMKAQTSLKTRHLFTMVQVHVRDPEGLPFQQDNKTFNLFEFVIPTQSGFIPSYMRGCSLLNVAYSVVVTMRLNTLAGKLFIECPIGMGPCEDPVNLGKTSAVPLFIRPKRFPHFTKESDQKHEIPKIQNGTVKTAGVNQSPREVTQPRYKSQTSSLWCCTAESGDF